MEKILSHTFLIVCLATAAHAALQNPETYWEMCDASAAVALDDTHFAVADDEGNTLRVYKRGEGAPVREYDVGKFLGGRKKAESDIEGAARVNDRVYWISSHGRNKDGEREPNRQRFFATEIIGQHGLKLHPIGKAYSLLLDDLLADARFARFRLQQASLLPPKQRGGLNIEGMCARADGALLIGFRSPVPNGKGLVVPLLNPDKVIEGERAKFGEMIELDLGGFGIRDLAPAGDGFLVLGGARDGSKVFHLFSWNGRDDKPDVIPGNFFEKLNPEAIFRFANDPPGVFHILSDDGGRKQAGKECKDLPKDQRHFRAGELHLDLPRR